MFRQFKGARHNHRFILAVAILPWPVHAEVALGINYLQQTMAITLTEPSTSATADKKLTLGIVGTQLSYSADNWTVGLAASRGDETQNWRATNNIVETVDYSQQTMELFSHYYFSNWGFSFTIGEGKSHFQQTATRQLPNARKHWLDRITTNSSKNQDRYYEFATSYWASLDDWLPELGLTMEMFVSQYDGKSDNQTGRTNVQVATAAAIRDYLDNNGIDLDQSDLTVYHINEDAQQIGVIADWSYPFNWLELDWLFATWQSIEFYRGSNGLISASRRTRGNAARNWQFDPTETSQVVESRLLSYGFDIDCLLTSSTSIGLSLIKAEGYSQQWQVSLFHQF